VQTPTPFATGAGGNTVASCITKASVPVIPLEFIKTFTNLCTMQHVCASVMDKSKRILMGVVWSEVKLLETGARFPELATADTTCKTNKQGRPLLKIQGLDGNGKMFTRANALLWNESEEAFLFVFKFALPKLWSDPVCQATSLIITDGDPHMISALKNALATTSFSECTLKRCFWHLVHQAFAKLFGNGELDLEVNTVIRKWLNSLAYRVETVQDFDESTDELKQWIRSNVDSSLMPRQKKHLVQISRHNPFPF
jgi:hypothetical protein